MATVFHTEHSQVFSQHQDNILASLSHRLETARAANNLQLVELLEQEKRQMTSASPHRSKLNSIASRFSALVQYLTKTIADKIGTNHHVQVSHLVNGRDEWWYAFDPRTDEYVYADSEAELRLWIKENYHGK